MKPHETAGGNVKRNDLLIRRSRVRNPAGSSSYATDAPGVGGQFGGRDAGDGADDTRGKLADAERFAPFNSAVFRALAPVMLPPAFDPDAPLASTHTAGTIHRAGPLPLPTRGDRLPLAYYPLAGLAVAGTIAVAGLLAALLARLGEWLLAAIAVRLAVWQ